MNSSSPKISCCVLLVGKKMSCARKFATRVTGILAAQRRIPLSPMIRRSNNFAENIINEIRVAVGT